LRDSGGEQYFGEPVTKLGHAEQCAFHAQQAGADEELILGALLHDIGHLIDTDVSVRDDRGIERRHRPSGSSLIYPSGTCCPEAQTSYGPPWYPGDSAKRCT
jgi:predicted HD phosphohydrolase